MSARPACRPAPHLHYELIVNGTKVDPMRVRLPRPGAEGRGARSFKSERARIDELLKEETGPLKVASAKVSG